ncbi:RHS repeat-associated protein [Variovorax boronicumulans]|uniref:RHS repeat-associated protein n=2 Tax=Variovorax boronicumulans TaxID=436515 RepID=A0AAW8CXS9_9BURK|nr:RHS repeat-associated core domain-containing protein [Variovorax boronicumulans]MDP9895027.1 RHS repeat-associated protein [Variovorax boronicumulans]MDP9993988.1 RHS repeat-associated protein [Variovorax boronicumulans]MDQ0044684.1 RHS repeat-associated protein [Variovorax boronicumulans]MDQ0054654.1 RHS repeat-associated protein [Variovorax boronicumulans]
MTDPRSFLQDRPRFASFKKITRSGSMKSWIAKWLWISLGFLALLFGTHANAASYWLDSRYDTSQTHYPTPEDACVIGELQRRMAGYTATSSLPHRYSNAYTGPDMGLGERICRGNIEKRQFNIWLPVEVVDTLVYGPLEEPAPACDPSLVDPITGKCAVPEQSCRRDDGAIFGAPILPATAEKYRSELDFVDGGPSPLSFQRTYRSTWGADAARPAGSLSKTWAHNHATALKFTPAVSPTAVAINNAEGTLRAFTKPSGATNWTTTNSADTLVQAGNGTWSYRRTDDDATLAFAADGKLQTLTQRNGWVTTYTYNAVGQLATITNGFGRTLTLNYNGSGLLASVSTPDLRSIAYVYDAAGRLSVVTYPDTKTRTYVYENATYPQALTGILDETGARFATFSYDAQGRAIDTQLAGTVNRYQVSYPSANSATVVDPLGTSRSYNYGTTKGTLAVTGGSLPSGSGGADAASRIQDANGFVTSETDFKGVVTTTTWDLVRRLPTTVVRASGTPEAQTVTTQWHPSFRLPATVTETGRITTYAYDVNGNLLSRAVTDTATSPNTTRTWQWTYNAQRLVDTQTEPNGAVTSYLYDTRGNLTTVTNALGHATLYGYDSANRVTSTTAPNGLVTTYSYDNRDRLLTKTVGAGLAGQQTTTLTYEPTGSVDTVTLPTGLVLSYAYDAAHRLTGWSNNRGESGTYTLDAMGNRTGEQFKNSGGAVAWNAVRTINNLNRLSARTEGPNQTNSFGYDANGELSSETNGLSQSTQYGLDGLRRVKTITNAANATAALAYNTLDSVTSATDFKGVATSYTRDALGNSTAEASADIGSESAQYDSLGLPKQITDALGQTTTITRDALGRPTQLLFADGRTTTLTYDATTASKGYLSSFTDRSGTTAYTRDAFGRVAVKQQTLANGSVQQVLYGHNANGTLGSISYPNGSLLLYSYDATGRLTGLNWNGQPLISGISWNALGQPTAWTWAFVSPALSASRTYDTAGRLTATEFGSYVYDAAGRITSLTQNLYKPGDTDPANSTIANGNVTWTVGYDALGRITGFNATGDTAGFGYDANGNRSSSTRDIAGQTTSRTYTVGSGSNRLTGFSQTAGAITTSVTYGYNTNGDLTNDGLRSFAYGPEGRLKTATTGATDSSPTVRYAHNALGQRLFKTEPVYPLQGTAGAALSAFFAKEWTPSTVLAEQLGFAFAYDEGGVLLSETGSGGSSSAGQAQHIYLPTAGGPMPVAAVIDGSIYAVHSDHLNTPRKLTNASGQAVWQWGYSAFGEDKPTLARNRFANLETTPNPGTTSVAAVKFNLRYPGQYADEESGLFYNYFRSYDARTGRYSQPDPIGLSGGWNRFGYVGENPLSYVDPKGLFKVCIVPGGCVDTNPPPVHPDFPDSGSPPLLPLPKPLPDSIVDKLIDFCTNKESAECSKIRGQCSERCADATFPTKDYAVSFRRCLNRCMRDNGCKATDAGEY